MKLLIFVTLAQRVGPSPSASPPPLLPNAVPPSSEPSPSTGMALSPNSDCDDLPDRLVARFTEEVARGHQVSGCPQLQARGLCSHLAARGLCPATCSLCGADCQDVQAQNLTDAAAGIGLQISDCQELLAMGAVPGRHRLSSSVRRGRLLAAASYHLLSSDSTRAVAESTQVGEMHSHSAAAHAIPLYFRRTSDVLQTRLDVLRTDILGSIHSQLETHFARTPDSDRHTSN